MCDNNNNSVREFSVGQLLVSNIVIPEIQREYVWGNSEIGSRVLDNFFEDILDVFKSYIAYQDEVQSKYEEILEAYRKLNIPETGNLKETAEKQIIPAKIKSNIGFLYTYDPYPDTEKKTETIMLIDGQQRMTTIFLLLLFSACQAGLKDVFYKTIRYEKNRISAFDFKVRQKTRDFLNLLIDKVFSYPVGSFKFSSIKDTKWYLDEYKTDISVCAMVNTLILWEKQWQAFSYSPEIFYNFLLNRIYFWRFSVSDTIQGEKLYITMNGRGRSLTAAEIIKAEVFRLAGPRRSMEVGKTFEDIYDFFWQHRSTETFSADDGVQKFFRWVYLLERYEKYSSSLADREIPDEDEDEDDNQYIINFRDALKDFELKTDYFSENGIQYSHIERFFYALKQLIDLTEQSNANVHKRRLSEYFFSSKEEKSTLFAQDSKSFQQQAFLLLPLIRWISNHPWDEKEKKYILDNQAELIRFCRYLRNIRSIHNVRQSINRATSSAILLADALIHKDQNFSLYQHLASGQVVSRTICPNEEVTKAKVYLANISTGLAENWEDIIWRIEDFKFSKIKNNEDSYAIERILTEFIENWNKDIFSLTKQHIDLLENCLSAFSSFENQLDESPDIVYQWLLLEKHLGYTEERSMIIPKSFCQLLETPDIIRAINDIELEILKTKNYKSVFEKEEIDFIRKYWPNREAVKDKMIQLPLYVSMCRVAGEPAFDKDYNKIGYWDTPPYDLNENIHTWCNVESQYVFRSLTNTNGRMRHDCLNALLKCHTIDEQILADMEKHYALPSKDSQFFQS